MRNCVHHLTKLVHPHTLENQVEMSAWATMNNEQQLKRIKRFRSDKGREFLNEVTSTNVMRSLIRTQTAGKKKKKRKRTERTRTPQSMFFILTT